MKLASHASRQYVCATRFFGTQHSAWFKNLRAFTLLIVFLSANHALADLRHSFQAKNEEPPVANDLLVVNNQDNYLVTPKITLLTDATNQLTIEEIVKPEYAAYFVKPEKDYLSFGYSNATYWIKIQIRYEPSKKRQPNTEYWYLEVAKPLLRVAELYRLHSDGSISSQQADLRKPYADRPLKLVNSVFPIVTLRDQTSTFFLKVNNDSALYIPIKLWKPEKYVHKVSFEETLFGVFYGGMLVLIAYNLFLFFAVQDRSYLYYVFYLASALYFEVIELAHGTPLYPWGMEWFNKEYIPVAIWCIWLSSFTFTRNFLELPKRHPIINAILTPVFIFSLIATGLCFLLPYELTVQVSVNVCGYLVSSMPLMGAWSWYKGNKNASFFTIAWCFNSLGFGLMSSVATGRAPPEPWLIASMPTGTLLEAVLLSFALAERIKRIQKGALTANYRALEHMKRYRSIFDNAPEGMYQLSPTGRIIDANRSLAKLLGYSSAQSFLSHQGKNAFDRLGVALKDWRRVLSGEPIAGAVNYPSLTTGSTRYGLHSANLVRDLYGDPLYIEGRIIDITDRHQLQQAEIDLVRERRGKRIAKAENLAKSEFLKQMSFEIRTALTPIIGFSEVLRSPQLAAESKVIAANEIIENSKSLLQLVNHILDYSKIEAGKMSVESIDIDLFDLLEKVHSAVHPSACKKQLRFTIEPLWPLPPRIMNDPTRIAQILLILCNNAIKHTATGEVRLEIAWDTQKSHLLFRVHDTGAGLSQRAIRSILYTDNLGGAGKLQRGGLPMAIVRALSTLLGGKLAIESTLGHGSTFTIQMRCKTPPREVWIHAWPSGNFSSKADHSRTSPKNTEALSQVAEETPRLTGKILLAEDNVVNQALISRLIRRTGAEVHTVENGQLAINAASAAPYDLILMDINMPVLNGLEATAQLRARGYSKPIYALTAEQGAEELQAALTAGCNGHLAKPVEKALFYQVISHCLTPQEASP
ncbi:Hypothetical protein HDN1F_20670 [gamma proteobacterium HdN1]|nr:Hypothetical protein HDN1F_20670 [gamma proteobacterium HdN1]